MYSVVRTLLPLLLLYVTGCTTPPPAREDWQHTHITQTHAVRPNALWVAESRGWKDAALRAYARATGFVERESRGRVHGSWVVVLDLDQTVLNNIEYQLMLDRKGVPFSPSTWRDWVEARKATAVPGALPFIARVNALGGHVALVTNRRDYEMQATIDNLNALGIQKGRDYHVLIPRAWPDGSDSKAERFASLRTQYEALGYPDVDVVAFVGDVVSDKPEPLKPAAFFCVPQGDLYGKPCEFEGVKR